jgi:hypothetical protein
MVNKFLVALGGVLAIGASALADGVIASSEVEAVVLASISALFVFLVPNKTP